MSCPHPFLQEPGVIVPWLAWSLLRSSARWPCRSAARALRYCLGSVRRLLGPAGARPDRQPTRL